MRSQFASVISSSPFLPRSGRNISLVTAANEFLCGKKKKSCLECGKIDLGNATETRWVSHCLSGRCRVVGTPPPPSTTPPPRLSAVFRCHFWLRGGIKQQPVWLTAGYAEMMWSPELSPSHRDAEEQLFHKLTSSSSVDSLSKCKLLPLTWGLTFTFKHNQLSRLFHLSTGSCPVLLSFKAATGTTEVRYTHWSALFTSTGQFPVPHFLYKGGWVVQEWFWIFWSVDFLSWNNGRRTEIL